jgi:hypothetical protein
VLPLLALGTAALVGVATRGVAPTINHADGAKVGAGAGAPRRTRLETETGIEKGIESETGSEAEIGTEIGIESETKIVPEIANGNENGNGNGKGNGNVSVSEIESEIESEIDVDGAVPPAFADEVSCAHARAFVCCVGHGSACAVLTAPGDPSRLCVCLC